MAARPAGELRPRGRRPVLPIRRRQQARRGGPRRACCGPRRPAATAWPSRSTISTRYGRRDGACWRSVTCARSRIRRSSRGSGSSRCGRGRAATSPTTCAGNPLAVGQAHRIPGVTALGGNRSSVTVDTEADGRAWSNSRPPWSATHRELQGQRDRRRLRRLSTSTATTWRPARRPRHSCACRGIPPPLQLVHQHAAAHQDEGTAASGRAGGRLRGSHPGHSRGSTTETAQDT
jgi:hypothetical protein